MKKSKRHPKGPRGDARQAKRDGLVGKHARDKDPLKAGNLPQSEIDRRVSKLLTPREPSYLEGL